MANPRLSQEPSYRYVNISSLLWSLLDGEIAHYRNEKADPLLMESPSLWIDQQTADMTTASINIEVSTHPPPEHQHHYIEATGPVEIPKTMSILYNLDYRPNQSSEGNEDIINCKNVENSNDDESTYDNKTVLVMERALIPISARSRSHLFLILSCWACAIGVLIGRSIEGAYLFFAGLGVLWLCVSTRQRILVLLLCPTSRRSGQCNNDKHIANREMFVRFQWYCGCACIFGVSTEVQMKNMSKRAFRSMTSLHDTADILCCCNSNKSEEWPRSLATSYSVHQVKFINDNSTTTTNSKQCMITELVSGLSVREGLFVAQELKNLVRLHLV